MTTILLPRNVQLDDKDNLLKTIVNLPDFFSLNLWRILSGGLGWSSHTVTTSGVIRLQARTMFCIPRVHFAFSLQSEVCVLHSLVYTQYYL